MAEVVESEAVPVPVEAPVTSSAGRSDLDLGRPRLSWGAVMGGAVAALGLWILLYVFGLAVGLSTINPHDLRSMRPSALFAGIWALIAPLIALFVGGWVAGRGAGIIGRAGGAVHGLVVWSLTTIFGGALALATLSAIFHGVVSVGQAVARANAADDDADRPTLSLDRAAGDPTAPVLDVNEALRPINERLQAQGQPPVSAAAIESAAREAANTAFAQGRWDRDELTRAFTLDTGLSQADANEVVDRLQSQYQRRSTEMQAQAQMQAQAAAQNAKVGALAAAEKSGKAFWGLFGALLFGLVASVFGGAAGASAIPRELRRERVFVPRAPLAPRREVYP